MSPPGEPQEDPGPRQADRREYVGGRAEHLCPLQGLVQEASWYWLKVQELLDVQEGLCAQVPCTFDHSQLQLDYLVSAYWFREGANIDWDPPVATNNRQRAVSTDTLGRFRLLRDPRSLNCSLSISDAKKSDTGIYFFRVEQGNVKHSYQNPQLCIRVTGTFRGE